MADREIAKLLNIEERKTTFSEVNLGYTEEQAISEATRCLNCKNPSCVAGCPVNINIPKFVSEIKRKDYIEADKTIKASNFLGSVCGRVCPQESQCEGQCILSRAHKPIAIGNLERFVSDKCADGQLDRPQQHLDLRVAVVGSGPSGLTCAYELARAGISVTIYEAFHRGGGVLTYGIPSFRLPKNIVNNQLNKLSALGVEIKYDIVIGKTLTIKQLLEDFDAVYVASGAGLPMFMNILGENLNGIVSANEFLTRVNLMNCANPSSKTPLYVGKDVIVVGAGNVAMDSARTAKRLGAKVTVVYRRSEAEMPARKEEIAHAKEEGIDFMLLTNPIAFNGVGKVESATLIKMQLGEVDASGRRGVTEIVGSEFTLPCDNVIIALGTKTSPLLTESEKALLLTKKGTIVVDESKRTSVPYVYAGGDIANGAATVILAMGDGKRASRTILEELTKK